jgi:hypothetical protein
MVRCMDPHGYRRAVRAPRATHGMHPVPRFMSCEGARSWTSPEAGALRPAGRQGRFGSRRRFLKRGRLADWRQRFGALSLRNVRPDITASALVIDDLGVARSVRRTPDAARGHRILSRGRSVKKASTSSGTPATLRRTQAVVRPCRRLNSHVHGGDCPRCRPTSLARCSDTRDQAACWTASVAQPASAIAERFTSS